MHRKTIAPWQIGFILSAAASIAAWSSGASANESTPVSFIARPATPQTIPLHRVRCSPDERDLCGADRRQCMNEGGRNGSRDCEQEYGACLARCNQ
jgi:hypothetical protein